MSPVEEPRHQRSTQTQRTSPIIVVWVISLWSEVFTHSCHFCNIHFAFNNFSWGQFLPHNWNFKCVDVGWMIKEESPCYLMFQPHLTHSLLCNSYLTECIDGRDWQSYLSPPNSCLIWLHKFAMYRQWLNASWAGLSNSYRFYRGPMETFDVSAKPRDFLQKFFYTNLLVYFYQCTAQLFRS